VAACCRVTLPSTVTVGMPVSFDGVVHSGLRLRRDDAGGFHL
jgi:hypothetical protein